jgi:hypothetical protein
MELESKKGLCTARKERKYTPRILAKKSDD